MAPEQGPALYAEVLAALPAFWGERDLRALHQPVWLRQLAGHTHVVRDDELLLGYLVGVVSTGGVAYVHLVATRQGARRRGVGRVLHTAFLEHARSSGAQRVEAITTPANEGSVAFHRRLGFAAQLVVDYAGPGQDRVLLTRPLGTGSTA